MKRSRESYSDELSTHSIQLVSPQNLQLFNPMHDDGLSRDIVNILLKTDDWCTMFPLAMVCKKYQRMIVDLTQKVSAPMA